MRHNVMTTPLLRDRTILVVDDNDGVREALGTEVSDARHCPLSLRHGRCNDEDEDETDGENCSPEARPTCRHRQFSPVHYWITSFARASTADGIVRPRALAVLRLITRSNFDGCSTGMPLGFAPLRILSTNVAARRRTSRGLE